MVSLTRYCAEAVPTIVYALQPIPASRARNDDLRECALRAADALPVVPSVLQRSLALFSRRDELSIAELAGHIEQDVVIAGTILGLANSAVYRGHSAVSSLRQAIVRLGINKARNVLLGLSVARSLGRLKVPGGWSLIRFNAHSLAAAILCDLIVRSVACTDPEWAFMAGLLHDLGLLAIACGLPKEFAAIMAHTGGGDAELVDQERNLLGFTHFEVGAEIMSRWNCPVEVRKATLSSQNAKLDFNRPLPLAAVVKSATLLADAQSMSVFDLNQDADQGQDATDELFRTLDIATPVHFFEEFHGDIRELHAAAA